MATATTYAKPNAPAYVPANADPAYLLRRKAASTAAWGNATAANDALWAGKR